VASGLVGGVVYLFGPPLARDSDGALTSEDGQSESDDKREVMCVAR
jgi:hypothetical protein